MQKLINDPADAVMESLLGLQLAYPQLLRLRFDPPVVTRADAPIQDKVAVISGSGSGAAACFGTSAGKGGALCCVEAATGRGSAAGFLPVARLRVAGAALFAVLRAGFAIRC